MTSWALAWRSLARQPARAVLGVTGVAAVGALLFDMLLLSRGLALSFQSLLDATGYDVRVTATPAVPGTGPSIVAATGLVAALDALPEVRRAAGVRWGRVDLEAPRRAVPDVMLSGYSGDTRGAWELVAGSDLPAAADDGVLAAALEVPPGARLSARGRCRSRVLAPLPVDVVVAGVARFPFEDSRERYVVTHLEHLRRLCREEGDALDLVLLTSAAEHGDLAAVEAVRRLRPDLAVHSNAQYVRRFQEHDFSYFRQISAVLSAITLFFAFLLLASLLTVSVNQRLAEVAALRALGFRRRRIAADLLWETAWLVGVGMLAALALGAVLAVWLDGLLRQMPELPDDLHFFVFWPGSLWRFVALLGSAGLAAAAYPIWLAARLPIAATLRREYVS